MLLKKHPQRVGGKAVESSEWLGMQAARRQKLGAAWDLWEISPHPGDISFWATGQPEGSCQMCILDFQAPRLLRTFVFYLI